MEFTYNNMVKFMKDYCKAFNTYAQDPKTVNRMCDYFAPDVEVIPYVAPMGGITYGRENFLKALAGHPSSHETFTPEDIMVDEKRKIIIALLRVEFVDKKTGEMLVKKHYLSLYQLTLDENEDFKIKNIRFFWEVLPTGTLEIHEVLARDSWFQTMLP